MATAVFEGSLTEVPLNDDGAPYPFVISFDSEGVFTDTLAGSTVFADTRTELVAHFLPSYGDIPEGEDGDNTAFMTRHEAALVLASALQEHVAAHAVNTGAWNHAEASEDVLTAVFTPRAEGPEFAGEWTEPVALLQVTTQFAPYTDREPVTGNVVWIDPTDEKTFLETLSAAGAFDMHVHADS